VPYCADMTMRYLLGVLLFLMGVLTPGFAAEKPTCAVLTFDAKAGVSAENRRFSATGSRPN